MDTNKCEYNDESEGNLGIEAIFLVLGVLLLPLGCFFCCSCLAKG